MDEDLEDRLEPGWNVEDFEVGGVFDPAMLPGIGFGTWYNQAGTIEPAKKRGEERQSTRAKPNLPKKIKQVETKTGWSVTSKWMLNNTEQTRLFQKVTGGRRVALE